MVVPTLNLNPAEKFRSVELPIIDLKGERSEVSKLIAKACEEYGFFKIINHGVPEEIISTVEEESVRFFTKPPSEKQKAGPANPYGYGCKNIGLNGDVGELEYLILHSNPLFINQQSIAISSDPTKFSSAANGYIGAVKDLACELLQLMAEGLKVRDTSMFSKLIRDGNSDSLLRLNYYPSSSSSPLHTGKVGFGEHSDPQLLTILRSNGVSGLQISVEGAWVSVPSDPIIALCVNVGDVLQAMTNGRFVNVRHRVVTNSSKSRMSVAFFAAPALHSLIKVPSEMVTRNRPCLYKPYTWAEYKKAMYSSRLSDKRLDLFRIRREEDGGY